MDPVIRQNQNALSPEEKVAFVKAVHALKGEKLPGNIYNTYDQFVVIHLQYEWYGHRGPAFLPWHRWFLKKFEEALQRMDSTLSLPYWDWSVDNSKNSQIWQSGFMGPNGTTADGQVTSGPFAIKWGQWPLKILIYPETEKPYLKRQMGPEPGDPSSLPTPQDVTDTLNQTPYDVPDWDEHSRSGFRNTLEGFIPGPRSGMHNRIHNWVSGSMIPVTSPNDPVFFLHHCFIDKLWADWQSLHLNEAWYLPTDGTTRKGHNLNDTMPPWSERTPNGVIDHRALGYRYDTDDYLLANEELYPTQWISSANGETHLRYYDDGSLWLWVQRTPPASGWDSLWHRPSPPSSGVQSNECRCIMHGDGRLVSYGPDGEVIWDSKRTAAKDGSYLQVTDTGRVVIYESDGKTEVWSNAVS
jgi:tyrosinase